VKKSVILDSPGILKTIPMFVNNIKTLRIINNPVTANNAGLLLFFVLAAE